ncbi:MAG: GrpB family protein [Acidobacteriia bacterium]|nr:GrpB family protein [Terriglobia bacterium]
MSGETPEPRPPLPLTEEELRARTIGELRPLSEPIRIVESDPRWPEQFQCEAERIAGALGSRALRIEHTGSTSVPGLAAKPILDMLLVVADSGDEAAYAPALEGIGYTLRIREAEWHEHRMFRGNDPDSHLHVFSASCPEIDRILLFRDWLRRNAADRELYEQTKRHLASEKWTYQQNYADAKTAVVEEILGRARLHLK